MNYLLKGYSIKIDYDFYCYNPYKDKSKILKVGYIVECLKGKDYGIVYHFDRDDMRSFLYIFHKREPDVLEKMTIVSFMMDMGANEDHRYEISDVTDLNEYILYNVEKESEVQSYCRSSKTQTTEKLMSFAKPYLLYYKDLCRLYYPAVYRDEKIIWYYTLSISLSRFPSIGLLGYYAYFQKYDKIKKVETTFGYTKKRIKDIIRYVDSLTPESILNQFSVQDVGHFQSFPGRDDDSFFYSRNWVCSSKDRYLLQLTDLKSESMGYDNCSGREKDDYSEINDKETEKFRAKIASVYNKSEHLSYLIKDFVTEQARIVSYLKFARSELYSIIKENDSILFTKSFSKRYWLSFIKKHNG